MQRLKIYAILLSAITISYFGGISLKQKIRTLTTAAIIAAAYAALTLLLAPISYGAVQFRVSEALTAAAACPAAPGAHQRHRHRA